MLFEALKNGSQVKGFADFKSLYDKNKIFNLEDIQ